MFLNLTRDTSEKSWLKQNADMLDQGMLLCSNTVILASQLIRSIPAPVMRAAKTIRCFPGVISINFQFRDLWKVERDFTLAAEKWDWPGLLYSAVRVALKAVDIFLTLGSFAIYALLPGLTPAYYSAVTPVAITSWFTLIAFDLIDHYQNHALLKEMESIKEEAKKVEIAQAFNAMVNRQPYHNIPLARKLLRQLDSYRLERLKKEGVTFEALYKNLTTSVIVNNADLLLKVYFYICLGVNKMFPETLVQALSEWSASLLFTAKLAYAKYA